ncbi:hypothetical protein [Polymorphospora rubra]|uniref:hypothetical protein n=1 Tax=Polymorphospora rubra TaxID=338584 RepID=UPI0033F06E76
MAGITRRPGEVGPGGGALAGLLVDLDEGRPAVKADLLALRQIAEMGSSTRP